MELAIISDTHIPSRAAEIPDWVGRRIEAADHTIHAGDFDTPEGLEAVTSLTGDDLTGVKGNVDGEAIDFPHIATVTVDGVEFVVTHGSGSRDGYGKRIADLVKDHGGPNAVGIAGHTHDPMDKVVDGVRILNPGSATGADPAEEATMLTARVQDGDLDVRLHRE